MNRKVPQLAIWPMWLALPFTASSYWRVWDRLPARMAVHFDANWQPNGWTSREGSLELALGIAAFLLLVLTIGSYAVRASSRPAATGWALLASFYLVIGFICFINNRVVEFNLNAHPQRLSVVDPEPSS